VAAGAISEGAANLMLSAISDTALKPIEQSGRDTVRASILKQMLIRIV
jgi:transcriptional regulator CtsR